MSAASSRNQKNTISTPAPASQDTPNPFSPLWLWENRIPRVGLTILEGPTGIGKTLCALTIAASVSRGLMPDDTPCPKGNVLYISAEDSPKHFLQPVLQRANAYMPAIDITRCSFNFNDESFTILDEAIKKDRPRLIVIDSLRSTLGSLAKPTEDYIAYALHRLFTMAWTHEIAVVLIRNTDLKSYPRVQTRAEKSPHLTAAAQNILLLSPDTTDPGSVLLSQSKCSLAGNTPTLSFRVTSDPAHDNPYPFLRWSSAPNLSGSDLRYLQHTGSLPHPDLSETILAILRDHLDQSLSCKHICQILDDPSLHANSLSQTLRRLTERAILTKTGYGLYMLPSPTNHDHSVILSNSAATYDHSVILSNSATEHAHNTVILSNSSTHQAQPAHPQSPNTVTLSNSGQTQTTPSPIQNPVILSNSSTNHTHNAVTLSNSAAEHAHNAVIPSASSSAASLPDAQSSLATTTTAIPEPSSRSTKPAQAKKPAGTRSSPHKKSKKPKFALVH